VVTVGEVSVVVISVVGIVVVDVTVDVDRVVGTLVVKVLTNTVVVG
jgi:hypothetical protein